MNIYSSSAVSLAGSASVPSLTSSATTSSVSSTNKLASSLDPTGQVAISEALAQLLAASGHYDAAKSQAPSITAPLVRDLPGQMYGFPNEESWKHTEQARAILSNLIGPNGEQLTSTDPYNTTVRYNSVKILVTTNYSSRSSLVDYLR